MTYVWANSVPINVYDFPDRAARMCDVNGMLFKISSRFFSVLRLNQ